MTDALECLETALRDLRVIDLSHRLEEDMPIWRDHSRYHHNLHGSYWTGGTNTTYQVIVNEHNGSHVDAPAHYVAQGPAHRWIDEVPLERHLGRYVLVDLSHVPEGHLVTAVDLQRWEAEHTQIPDGRIVLLRYGWTQRWGLRPNDTAFLSGFPGLAEDAAQYLVSKQPRGVGVDTVSVDVVDAPADVAHTTLLEAQVPIFEQLALADLPPAGFFIALPLNIAGGSGSPVRAAALVPRGD